MSSETVTSQLPTTGHGSTDATTTQLDLAVKRIGAEDRSIMTCAAVGAFQSAF